MKLEDGKTYITRDNKAVTVELLTDPDEFYAFRARLNDGWHYYYSPDGRSYADREGPADLIAEPNV